MTDLPDAPPPAAGAAAAPQQWQLPWSSSSPPSPIDLWHVARGAAAARTALEEEEEEQEEEEESWAAEEGRAEEEDEGASRAFDASTLSYSDNNEEEGSKWTLEELLSVQRRSVNEELGEGAEGGGGEEGDGGGDGGGRGRSSPSGASSRARRNRSLSRRSRSPSLGEEPSTDERLDDLLDSMLAMTVRRRMGRGEKEREAKKETTAVKKIKGKFLASRLSVTLRV